MNNLLDRMIVRAQRALSSAEPLVVPTYAELRAPGSVERDWSTAPAIRSGQPISHESPDIPVAKRQDIPALDRHSFGNEQKEIRDPAPHSPGASAQARTQSTTAPQRNLTSLPSMTSIPVTLEKAAELPQQSPQPENTASSEEVKLRSSNRDLVHAYSLANPIGRESQSSAMAQNRPQPQAPIEVSISIGHIEVRAVQKNRPVSKAAPLARVTLDDYLHRRNKGSR